MHNKVYDEDQGARSCFLPRAIACLRAQTFRDWRLLIVNDDDDVFPNHLERLLFAAESLGADFVYSDTYLTILDPNGKVVRRMTAPRSRTRWQSRVSR